MKAYDLISFDDPGALALAAAEAWMVKMEATNRELRRPLPHPYCVAISGGRIARDFFAAIAENAKKRAISWANVHFFWADERCVPPTDPESNFALADQWLFKPLGISPDQVHRIQGEIAPEEAAEQAALELRRFIRTHASGQPMFDLIFLGMGEDGHVASLFPEMPAERISSTDVYQAVTASKPPPRRISAALEVWVLASGARKSEALQRSLMMKSQTPFGRVLAMRRHTTIFSDVPLETVKP
jgi:6-phosphogluconolactonase